MTAKEKLASVKIYGRNVSEFLLPDQMEFIERAMDEYAEFKQNSHKHGVMQAEGSASVSGAAVASEEQGTVTARGHKHKWHDISETEKVCYMCGETRVHDAGSSYEE